MAFTSASNRVDGTDVPLGFYQVPLTQPPPVPEHVRVVAPLTRLIMK
jgi:hypothetical protein